MREGNGAADETPPDAARDRPVTEASYGIPDDEAGLLPWSFVADRLREDRTFWMSTTLPDGRPHARPVWGVFVDGRLHCGGGEETRWVRNVARDPRIVVHRESGEDVVILDGIAERLDAETADAARLERIDDAYEEKYGIRHGTPVFSIRPTRVLAWSEYPTDATRWRFDGE
ncbi:pyridoxamine 5'-phosphate oxidase family protein [Halogeometricum limi]|uniref:Pyridoxamine 5'-phosphate oxidase n=1 Tax=Halogeometricum limi TaxID=555875 RepID=A0A1I6GMY3_9EURY|nr:pyridoxamine 5'-phosphate oxidase family protein [Halogeometricum limi]SFR43481.1 Pyridoxamine 5'-phosphate oxidase [Halogeometricum limi]